jgi:O-antigen ligase
MCASLPSEGRDAQYLVAVLSVLLGLAILLIGSAGPDERLLVQGIPLTTVLYLGAGCVALATPCLPQTLGLLCALVVPVAAMGVTIPISVDQEAGAEKLCNLLISTVIASLLLVHALQRVGTATVLRLLVGVLALLLAGALVFKARFGFFERQVPFLMSGPIVFGRVMGLACLCSLLALRGPLRLFLTLIFVAATVWTASKGPIVALLLTIMVYVLLLGSRADRVGFALMTSVVVIGVAANYEFISGLQPVGRLFMAADTVATGGGVDSIGSRISFAQSSLRTIAEHPFGVGLGGWSAATGVSWMTYPHNFWLELWTEGGVLLGTLASLPFLVFLLRKVDALWILCVFFLLAQQVSGDLLDGRYWLTFSIVGLLHRPEGLGLPRARARAHRMRA